MATRSARGLAAAGLILFTLAACGGSSTGSRDPADGSTRAAAPSTASEPEPSSPAESANLSGRLADLIPDVVGGVTLTKETVAGPDLGELEPDDAASFAALLKKVDGLPEDFSAVKAMGKGISIVAMRMEGTDGRQLGEAMIGVVTDAAEGNAPVEDVSVAGKDMKRISPPDTTPIHVYVTGEVMFVVQAADPALVGEAFSALP